MGIEHGFLGFPWKIPPLQWVLSTVSIGFRTRCLQNDRFILQIPKFPIPLHSSNRRFILQCLFQTWFKRPLHTKPSAHRQPKQHTSPDGGIGRRAGLKHQWSNPCRFDPGSGYEKDSRKSWVLFSCTNKAQVPCSLLNPCQLTLTSPVRGIPPSAYAPVGCHRCFNVLRTSR